MCPTIITRHRIDCIVALETQTQLCRVQYQPTDRIWRHINPSHTAMEEMTVTGSANQVIALIQEYQLLNKSGVVSNWQFQNKLQVTTVMSFKVSYMGMEFGDMLWPQWTSGSMVFECYFFHKYKTIPVVHCDSDLSWNRTGHQAAGYQSHF